MSYKLYYFDGRGRGEIIRLIFAATGTKYEDIRFSMEEWGSKFKAIAPTGVAPWLEDPVSGKTLVQSTAIARLLATRHGLMGSDHIEYYKIERILHQLKDVEDLAVTIMFGPEEKRDSLKKDFIETKGPYHFGTLAKYLKDNTDSHFAAGKSLSLADLAIIGLVDFAEYLGTEVQEIVASHTELTEHRKHVLESNKTLADYLANRKATPW